MAKGTTGSFDGTAGSAVACALAGVTVVVVVDGVVVDGVVVEVVVDAVVAPAGDGSAPTHVSVTTQVAFARSFS